MVNIVEAYLKYKGQCIILISGFSGSGKTTVAKFLASLFKFKFINLNHYHIPKEAYDIEKNYVILKNDSKVLNWDNIYESVNWEKLNNDIDSFKTQGVILCGFGFPKSLLKFNPDYHLHIKISKQNLLKNREDYYDRNKMVDIDREFEKTILNQITFPLYLKIAEDSTIDKYINANDVSEDKIKEETFSYLMFAMNEWLKHNVQPIVAQSNITQSSINPNTHKSDKSDKREENGMVKKNIIHNDKSGYAFDEFYYPNRKNRIYDFNDEGIDYPEDYIAKHVSESELSSDSDSDSSNPEFLFTTNGRELSNYV